MTTLLYFLVMAALMLGISHVMPGFEVKSFGTALIASLVLALLNTLLKPILFLLTLPLTILTLGLFLLVLNALMLWLASVLVPGFHLHGFGTTLLASLILALVGAMWKAATRKSS